ncbi:hypothetical protein [Methylomonas lenta]|uniref:hypothetical protein n=1 Tax=Methylomonas lenta TaxID=980561 RepID=UPI000AB6F365|nr:hypothetical protein [Methylomonas lenta]
MTNILTTATLLMLLVACSSSNDESSANQESHKALYNAANQPLEKAKAVEQEILEHAEQQKKQMEDL